MKHRKIGQQLADDIAKAIADKAFEHLIPAAQKRAPDLVGVPQAGQMGVVGKGAPHWRQCCAPREFSVPHC